MRLLNVLIMYLIKVTFKSNPLNKRVSIYFEGGNLNEK